MSNDTAAATPARWPSSPKTKPKSHVVAQAYTATQQGIKRASSVLGANHLEVMRWSQSWLLSQQLERQPHPSPQIHRPIDVSAAVDVYRKVGYGQKRLMKRGDKNTLRNASGNASCNALCDDQPDDCPSKPQRKYRTDTESRRDASAKL